MDRLLAALAEAGLEIDVRKRIAIQRVLESLDGWIGRPAEDVARHIAPILARSPEEQERFYKAWADFMARAIAEEELPAELPTRNGGVLQQVGKWLRKYWWSLPLTALAALLAYVYLLPLEPPTFALHHDDLNGGQLEEGDAVKVELQSNDSSQPQQAQFLLDGKPYTPEKGGIWKFKQGRHEVKATLEKSRLWRTASSTVDLQLNVSCYGKPQVYPNFGIQEDGRTVKFEISVDSNIPLRQLSIAWHLSDGFQFTGPSFVHTFDSLAGYMAHFRVSAADAPDCPLEDSLWVDLVPLEDDRDTTKIATLPDLEPFRKPYTYSRRISPLVSVGIPLAFTALVFSIMWLFRRKKARKHAAQKAARQARFALDPNGPYNIPWPNQDHQIAWGEELDRVAAAMTGRSVGERLHLDMARTVQATVTSAGMPSLRFRGQSQPLSWLILVDEGSLGVQELRLVAWWIERLKSETVIVDDFSYRDRPDFCWRQGHGGTLALHQLQALYATHRLIVVSRGDGLMHAVYNHIADAVADGLKPWAHRTLLTPVRVREWAGRERALSQLFGICPVEGRAMLKYFLLPHTPDGEGYRDWRRDLLRGVNDARWQELPARFGSWAALREALGPGLLPDWAMALHTYPEPVWELTVATGAQVKGEGELLDWDELWDLLRLPFMQLGRYSPKLKKEVQELAQVKVIRQGHEAVVRLLEGAKSILAARGQRGVANTEIERELALQQFSLNPSGAEEQAAIAAMQAEGLDLNVKLPVQKSRIRVPVWLMATIVAVVLGGTGFGISLVDVQMEMGQERPFGMGELDSTSVKEDWILVLNRAHESYRVAKQAYEGGDYVSALSKFKDGLDNLNGEIDRTSVQEERGKLADSDVISKYENAIGLSAFYSGDSTEAVARYYNVMNYSPFFYEEVSPELPNLQSLVTSNEKLFRSVEGVVRDRDGKAINGATVMEVPGRVPRGLPATTDGKGRFKFDYAINTVPDPMDSLQVVAPYFKAKLVAVPEVGPLEVVLEREQCPQQVPIEAMVIKLFGQPVSGLEVVVDGGRTTESYEGGFKTVACGKIGDPVHIQIKAPDLKSIDTTVAIAKNLKFVMFPQARILLSGTVTDADGNPVPGYEVLIDGRGPADWTGEEGMSFSIPWRSSQQMTPRTARVQVLAPGFDTLERFVNLPAVNQEFRILRSKPDGQVPDKSGKNWEIMVVGKPTQKVVESFDFFLDGKRVGSAGIQDDGRISISPETYAGTSGKFKVQAKGYADYQGTWDFRQSTEIELELHPALVELQESMRNVDYEKGDFEIGAFEITQAQWETLMPKKQVKVQCPTCPVANVDYLEVMEFIQKLNAITGEYYRLPNVDEWEYAARGGIKGDQTPFSGGKNLSGVGWYSGNSGGQVHPVGGKTPNSLELFDMSGNVAEWCEHSPSGRKPDMVVEIEDVRMVKGGSYASTEKECRIDADDWDELSSSRPQTGFRLVREYKR